MFCFNKKIVAILLIGALFQKLSVGLYLHNWLHEKKQQISLNPGCPIIEGSQVHCTCLDDALMPLAPPADPPGAVVPEICTALLAPRYYSFFIVPCKALPTLRGPPPAAA